MGQQVLIQLVGVGVTLLWSGVLTFVILKVVDAITGLRVNVEEETGGSIRCSTTKPATTCNDLGVQAQCARPFFMRLRLA